MALKIDFMKKVLLRALFFLIPFLWSIYVCSQTPKAKDCSTTCFTSEIVSAEVSGSCTSYELKISYSGVCSHALSHYSVAVPCGKIESLWNSENWKQVIGTDPTTGMRGFKIDDIAGFGEGTTTSFNVKFTVCAEDENCARQMDCWQPLVAYKASTCVNYETVTVGCKALKASIEKRDASCFEGADGFLSVVIEDGQAPFTFLWSNSSSAQSISGLEAGTYSVVVRDASGAEITLEETIAEGNQISVSGISYPAACNGVANGSIDLTVAGGTAPYTYSWGNGPSTEDIYGLLNGVYSVTVKDTKGCTVTKSFNINSNTTITINSSLVNSDCNATNGSINLTVSGGSAPYSFRWSTGQTTEDISNIGDGAYSVTVRDNAGCSEKKDFFVIDNNTLSVTGTTTAASCTDDPSGTVNITVTGGTEPYTFTWSNGLTSEDLGTVSSGYYTVVVTDAKGCTTRGGFAVSKTTFQVARTVVQPTCYGDNNGSITLGEPIGGTAPYSYLWSNGETGTFLTNLSSGFYSVAITDATGCSRTYTITISNPVAITASASVSNSSCNTDGNFSIDLTPSGGTAPYSYEWSNGATTEDLTGLQKGSYTLLITDAHGCSLSKAIIVEGESATWACLIVDPLTTPSCLSSGNTLSASVTDADTYSWTVTSSDGSWAITNQNAELVTYSAGSANSSATFTLTITKDGCTKTCSYSLTACTPQNNDGDNGSGGDEPGGGEPGGEDPGGETPGEEGPVEGGDQSCDECFNTVANVVGISGACRTYEIEVNTNGLCRNDLSHWTIAIPCGTVSDYSNSEGWKMEVGEDPTTGLYGLKVDDITRFGKEAGTFKVRFTLCESNNCNLTSWNPVVGYKAGQCVATGTIALNQNGFETHTVSVYPNPFNEAVNFEWQAVNEYVSLEIIDQYGNTVERLARADGKDQNYFIKLESSSLPKGMYYYRLTVDGKTYNGKISKR